MEDTSAESTVKFSVFSQRMKDWQILAIPIAAIVMAELLLYMHYLQAGIFLHVMIPLCVAIASMWIHDPEVTSALEGLMLLPMLRLVNISMPVFFGTSLYLYLFIYAPLFIPIYVILRHQRLTLKQIGWTLENMYLYLPLALVVGYLIGLGEYNIITVGSLIPDTSAESIFKLSFVMFIFVGLIEEVIFRSLLQTRLQESFGMTSGLLVSGILFGMMHSGYGTVYEIFFTAVAGIVIGYMFQRTGSLPLVAITHGFVNVFLFGLIPLLGPGLGLF